MRPPRAGFLALILLTVVGCSSGGAAAVPNGDWELVRLDYDGVQYDEPLFLRSTDGLLGGEGACNAWGEDDDGQIVQNLAGCGDRVERIDDALHEAVGGDRRVDRDGHLFLEATGIRAEYRPVERVTPTDVFALLSDENRVDVDPLDLLFDAEGGPPQRWDRIVALEDDRDIAEFHIGVVDELVCFHVGVATPRETAASSCREARDVRTEPIVLAAGFPVQKVRAALIPDRLLAPPNDATLDDLGVVAGNLFIPDGTNALVFDLVGADGEAFRVEIPALLTEAG